MPPEQDQYLPIASVTRIMRNAFGYDRKYISFVTAEASDTCQSERRTTITAGDMLSAMSNLGFEDYVEPLNVFIHRYRLSETDRGCSLRGETSSFDPAYGGSGTGFHGPPHHGPTPHGPPPHGTLPYGPLPHVPPPPGPYVRWISLWLLVVVVGTTQTVRIRMELLVVVVDLHLLGTECRFVTTVVSSEDKKILDSLDTYFNYMMHVYMF
ncbi:hypothetical protein Bca52824_096090 [Brassica carinata]|uniref:Transcription factor CBF/NF-Y/archaeal histone domain-containing protein n=1 Tax=Brassica carinata TaxID=52824 RepID=A0A8X7P189_BRACI|nr:hypothetical protein Bca52824_096090 [Brassica carinata]